MKKIITVTLNPAFDLHYGMESFEAQKENYVQTVKCDAGGKGVNTSRALTVNGVDNVALVVLGEENGASFLKSLTDGGMKVKEFFVPGRIRENITLHPQGQKETRISLGTFRLSPDMLGKIAESLEKETLSDCLFSFSGRVPKGLDKEDVKRFLRRLIAGGAKVIVDSNSLTPDDLADVHPWFIKPNEQEIVSFLGEEPTSPEEVAESAKKLVLRGVAEEVMVSLGGDGAVWSDGKKKLRLTVPKLAHPASTIGAGDSTLAGYLAGTAAGLSVSDALSLAVSYGTAACLTPGTEPPLPADVRKIRSDVRVTEL